MRLPLRDADGERLGGWEGGRLGCQERRDVIVVTPDDSGRASDALGTPV